jgi:hypothetical protein
MFLGSRELPVRRAHNLTGIFLADWLDDVVDVGNSADLYSEGEWFYSHPGRWPT